MTIAKINELCVATYGCGILAIDATAALWLAESVFKTTGINIYRTISNRRNKFGMGTAFPAYGTALFNVI